MYVLKADNNVFQLRFFPDSRRLLVGTVDEQQKVNFEVWTLSDGGRVRFPLPRIDIQSWWYSGYGNPVEIHPSGERCYIAWNGKLFSFRTADGAALPVPEDARAHQVFLSPDGNRLLTAVLTSGRKELIALKDDDSGIGIVWRKEMQPYFRHVAGFLPDGERFVTIDARVCLRTFAADEEQEGTRYPTYNANQPHLSPDGRYLGVIGYSSMYVYDMAALDKPRRITSTRSFGDFVSFAFHPDGRTMAVIHGGPTLVKVYDLGTLRRSHTFKWKIGPLGCVAFSPDGMLGAAGSHDGRIVIWDVDM